MKDNSSLLKDIEEIESEIEEIRRRIPPHSVKYDLIQLLEEKECQLERKKDSLLTTKAGPNS